MIIIESPSRDPEYNFSLEQELLEREGDFLLLYINSPCVVIGRNQRPEAEADLDYCARANIPVVRRITGGGAVWHDEGNINWAFVASTEKMPPDEKPLAPVIAVLRELGVRARAGSRGELLCGGKKISGTASCVKRGRRLFHGTLLFDADLDRMARALAGDPAKRGRRVASVPANVANVGPLAHGIDTARKFMAAMAAGFDRYYA